jgi:hypothetical protein
MNGAYWPIVGYSIAAIKWVWLSTRKPEKVFDIVALLCMIY